MSNTGNDTSRASNIKRFGRLRTADLILYCLAILVFILPLIKLVLMSFAVEDGYGFEHYSRMLQDARAGEALRNTLLTSVISNVISVAGGSLAAVLVAYVNIRGKKLIEALVLLPFVIPGYIITLSWTGVLAPQGRINSWLAAHGLLQLDLYTLGGMILMLGICHAPIVYLSVIHALRKVPLEQDWAARACGYTVWQTLWKIDLVTVRPAIISGAILAFLSTIDNFAIPAFLGIPSNIPVLSTYIYEKVIGLGPSSFRYAAALSVLLSAIALGGTLSEQFFRSRGTALESTKEDFSSRITLSRGWRNLLEGVLFLGLFAVNIVPLCYMIVLSFMGPYAADLSPASVTLDNFRFVFTNDSVSSAVANSLFMAGTATIICMFLGTLLASEKVRKGRAGMVLVEKAASVVYAIPGIVLALALIFYWVEPIPGFRPGLYGTSGMLIVAYVTRYIILQIKGSGVALLAIDFSLEEAARVAGSSVWRRWVRILLPLLIRPILASAFLIFVSALTELTLSSILASANTQTIGLSIFNLQQAGDYNFSIAFSSVIVLALFTGFFCYEGIMAALRLIKPGRAEAQER